MSEDLAEYSNRSGMEALELLQQPDPEPDLLPALRPDLELQEQTAGHLIRAILKAEARVEQTEKDRDAEILAWNRMIQQQKDRVASWRCCVRDWMLRNEVTKLQSPFFTASLAKGRKKLTWQEEDKVIGVLDALGATDAVKTVRSVVKKELQVAFDSVPGRFDGIVTEEVGEPGLRILKREG